MADANRVEAVERALSILEAFTAQDHELSLATLATRTGLYKSTILRLLGSLERFGYIRRSGAGLYRLGPSLRRLANISLPSDDHEAIIRPHLIDLNRITSETAAFFIRSGDDRLCQYRENSRRPIRHHLDEGVILPLKRGASGRVLLAFGGATGEPYDIIRSQGYYFSYGERDPDVMAVAVPVFNRKGLLLGSLSVSALRSRFDGSPSTEALILLQEHAAALREVLDDA